jgi:hypothetical protein
MELRQISKLHLQVYPTANAIYFSISSRKLNQV